MLEDDWIGLRECIYCKYRLIKNCEVCGTCRCFDKFEEG